jgi:phage repressor protein C with HTH and peptisase S24 domain
MDMDAHRRKRLQELVDIETNGNVSEYARRHAQDATRLRQILNPNYRGGRSFGEGTARRLESELNLPALYFDRGIDAEAEASGGFAYHKSEASDRANNGDVKRLTGVRKEVQGGNLFPTEDLPQPTEEEFALVPQLDIAAACGSGRFEDHVVVKGGLAFKKSFLREYGVPEEAARIIYASGESMSPRIQDGRVVLINTAERSPSDGRIYAVCTPDGGLVLKRLVHDYHPSAGAIVWILRSDNADKIAFPDKILPPDDRTMIIGRAVWTDSIL